jgi:N4-gp56 family major capsid protein
MPTTTTATTNFNLTVTAWVQRRVLENLRGRYVHALPGNYQEGEFIKGTNLITLVAYPDLPAITSALTEGTPPTDQALSINVESFSATQIGGTVAISDVAALQSPHNLLEVASERVGDQAAKSIDELVRLELLNSTNVIYSNGAARSAVTAVLTGDLVKRAVAQLQANDVPPFPDGFYRAIIHPWAAGSLMRDTASGGWMDIYKYTNTMGGPLSNAEIGMYAGVRFLVSTRASRFLGAGGGGANVYATTFFGPDAYVLQWMQRLQVFVVPPGGDHVDPIAQKAIIGWKTMFGCRLIRSANVDRTVRVESTALNG